MFNGVTCGSLENMAYHSPYLSKQDQHAVIHFMGTEGYQAVEIHWWMQAMYSNACTSKTTVKD
jgi:hypothetical protein